jgi:ABC-type transport system substrate-binding protein
MLGCDNTLPAPIAAANTEATAPRHGGILRTATFGDIRSLDPANMGDGLAPQMLQLIYAGLLDYDDHGNIVPDLAEHFVVSDQGQTYRFTLRPSVRFHDGAEFTARDVERTFLRGLAPKTPNPSKSFYFGIEGAEAYSQGKAARISGIHVLGTYLVEFHLHTRDATFPSIMALQPLRPVCPSAGDEFRADFFACGTGPFRLQAWHHGESVSLTRFEGYHRAGLPYLDGVDFQLGTVPISQRMKFERGQLDLIRDLTQADLVRFLQDPRWRALGAYDAEIQMAGEAMNTELRPMDNVELRRAVASAINREEYRLVKPTMMTSLTQPVPQGIKGHSPALQCQKFDLKTALTHMKNAGYGYDPASGSGGYPEVIPYYAYGNSLPEYTSQILAQQLRRIGIRIDVRLVSYAAWLSLTQRRHGVAFSYQGWKADYSDPSDFTEVLFHSKAIDAEGSNNPAFYSNAALDAKMDRAKQEVDESTRAALYDSIQQDICNDAPWAFTYSVKFYNLRQGYVRNYKPHPLWINDVRTTWLDRASTNHAKSALLAPARTLARDL